MALTPDRLTGAADPSLALFSAQLHKEGATDLIARRLPDIQKKDRKPAIDHFVQRSADVGALREQHLLTSLRGLAGRYGARSGAAGSSS